MSPIGMAVIGTGYMGRTYAACLTRHVPDGRLVSVWGGKRAPALAEEFGATHVIFRLYFPGMPHRHILRELELLAREVVPAFR